MRTHAFCPATWKAASAHFVAMEGSRQGVHSCTTNMPCTTSNTHPSIWCEVNRILRRITVGGFYWRMPMPIQQRAPPNLM